MTCYQNAMDLNPDFAEAYNNLGNALMDQGIAEIVIRLCNALMDQGKLEEAIRYYEMALTLDASIDFARENLTKLKNRGG